MIAAVGGGWLQRQEQAPMHFYKKKVCVSHRLSGDATHEKMLPWLSAKVSAQCSAFLSEHSRFFYLKLVT